MPTRIYTVSPTEIATIRQNVAGLPSGNEGTFFPPGHPEVELGVSYNGTSKLTVTILKDAWYESSGEVWDALDKLMPADSLPLA